VAPRVRALGVRVGGGRAGLALCASSAPETCRWIGAEERDYLRGHGLGVASAAAPAKGKRGARRAAFPWRLFRFRSAWATIYAHAAFNFGRYFVYNSLLGFYVKILGTTPVVAGQQVLLGQVADTIGKFAFAPFVDRAIRVNPRSKTRVRKVVSGMAFLVFALAMLGLAVATSTAAATALLVACKVASSVHVCGFKSNYLDQTKRHAGAFSGASNTLATLAATLSPLVGGALLDGTRRGWVRMFVLVALVNVSAAVLWVTLASGDSLDDRLGDAPPPGRAPPPDRDRAAAAVRSPLLPRKTALS